MASIKLNPPYVNPSIPAQLIADSSTSVTTVSLTVPFELSRAVGWADIKESNNVALILKTVSTGKILLDNIKGNIVTHYLDTGTPAAQFEIPINKFEPLSGQYYKVQIALISTDGTLGYFSDVAVVKYTNLPTVSIAELTSDVNAAQYVYTGTYVSSDLTEKVYSYEFEIHDATTGLLHDSSGVLLHNSSTDIKRGTSSDTWTSYKTLINERLYTITYKVTTLNGLKISTAEYGIMAMETLDLVSKNTEFIATMHSDDAYVHVHIMPKDADADIKAITGNFILVRSSSEDGFASWDEVHRFTLINNYPLMSLWKDFTVQQGYSYKYAVQAYNSKGVYSNRLECKYYTCEDDERRDDINRQMWNAQAKEGTGANSNFQWHYLQEWDGSPIQDGLPVDFEDAFLYDGKRQLKIRYNPKIASFKSTLLETKVDTIGGKYPFIFRNGNVEYKEFPISGLITMLSDENSLFIDMGQTTNKVRQYTTTPPYDNDPDLWMRYTGLTEEGIYQKQVKDVTGSLTALTAANFRKEREFKMEVLQWLTNGEPKLFRSPSEGNFIVRLMNCTLTPNDTVGRLLHTFQCTAYEVAKCDYATLTKYKFIHALDTSYQELKFKVVNTNKTFSDINTRSIAIEGGAYYFVVVDQWSDLILRFTYMNGTSQVLNVGNSTGQYAFDKDALKNNPIVTVTYQSGAPDVGSKIIYGYYDTTGIAFSLISRVSRETVVDQIVGHPQTSYRVDSYKINYIDTIKNGLGYKDLVSDPPIQVQYGKDEIPRITLGKFYYLKAEPREITRIFLKDGIYYETAKCDYEVRAWDDTYIYQVYTQNGEVWQLYKQYSGRPENNIVLTTPDYRIKLNARPNNGLDPIQEENVDLSYRGGPNAPITTGRYELYFDLDKIESLYIGSGVMCEICYNINVIHYEVEDNSEYTDLVERYNNWQNLQGNYARLLQAGQSKMNSGVESARIKAEEAYHKYLNQLSFTLEQLEMDGETYYAL